MFKKGLVTLVCLIVMSAVWSWATATYTVMTEISSLGTKLTAPGVYEPIKGGSIKTRATDAAPGVFIIALQELTIPKGSTVTEDKNVEVLIDAYTDYKIASVVKTSRELVGGVETEVNQTLVSASENLKTKSIIVSKPAIANRTQSIKVTFTADTTSDVIKRTWQLQANNNNGGGSFTLTRDGVVTPHTTVGKPLVKNYIDTTPVTVTATPKNSGYKIDYVVINGVKDNTDRDTFSMTVSGNPLRLNTFNFGYKKLSIPVTTTTTQKRNAAGDLIFVVDANGVSQPVYDDLGILPINPVADPYGVVRLIVSPVGIKNVVNSISVRYADDNAVYPAANVVLTDRFGDPVTELPFTGAVKVTIKGLTEAVKVTASYGFNAAVTAAAQNCTQTCHLDTANVPAPVRAAAAEWGGSAHATQTYYALDCVYCHQTMPGPTLTATTCTGCHAGPYAKVLSAGHAAGDSCLKCHNQHSLETAAATCAGCHTTTPALVGDHAAVNCESCHGNDMHNPAAIPSCATCHSNDAEYVAWAAGPHGTATSHTTGTCQRCHTTEGAINGAATGWTGGYADVLSINTYTAVPATNGVGCAACHDAHNGSLRSAKTIVAGAVADWNPNGGATTDQYDVCTTCHTLTDNAGALVGNYHDGGSINVTRTISDSHFDNPATVAAGGATAVVEGYVIRKNSANPCADCHNLHSADLTVQEAWAKSAHAGKIATKKEEAACAQAITWFNTTYPTNLPAATTCTENKTVGTSTRTVLSFFQRSTDGVALYKTTGALDDAAGNAWTHYDWDSASRASCARCHTATGIANFLTAPAAYSTANNNFSHLAAGQNELLYCWGCHSDSQSGALRNPGAITEVYAAATTGDANGTATIVHSDFNKSNVCMGCHLGREIGQNVKNDSDADGIRSFINSHYLAAGLTISGKGGYEFAGQSYSGLGFHKNVGVNNAYNTGTEGPCVTCHMSGAEAHTFEVSAASTACANCHGGLTTAVLDASKHEFHLALEELNTALKANGIHFYPAHPYFYSAPYVVGYTETGACSSNLAVTNWNKGATNIYKAQLKADGITFDKCVLDTTNAAYNAGTPGTWKDVMGAAFNYNLLDHEPGAYAHNRQYSLKLIQDSIDYLADGAVDGVGASAVVTGVMADEAFAEATSHAAAIVATATPATTCADCHTPAPHYGGNAFLKAQYVSTTSQPVTCANCHGTPADATAYQTILGQYADSAHAAKDAEAWIHYDWRTANRSACARCHNGTAFVAKLGDANSTTNIFAETDVLKPGETLACSACHTDAAAGELRTPSTSFTINMKNGATVEYSVDGASALCARCHSGRETGDSIKADMAADGARVFIDSHYQPVTGALYNNGGYEYASQSYDSLGSHKTLGASGSGPCVTCHMAGGNHSFVAASCATCHNGTAAPAIDAVTVKAEYDSALNGLKLALEAKGIHYGPVHPFFFTAPYVPRGDNVPVTNWAIGGANWKDVMGAAFNYNMLWSDKGAYAHNNAYAMKLIQDSTAFMGTVVLP